MEVITSVKKSVVCDVKSIMKILEVAQKRGEVDTKKNGSKHIKCESGNIEVDIISDYDKKRDTIIVNIVISNMLTIIAINAQITKGKQDKIDYGVYNGGFTDDDISAKLLHDITFDDFESMMKRSGYTKMNNVTFGELFLNG